MCEYFAVTLSSSLSSTWDLRVSVTVTESLVQVTVVAGPPVEIQVRVNMMFGSREKITSADTERLPVTISEIIERDFAHDRTRYRHHI